MNIQTLIQNVNKALKTIQYETFYNTVRELMLKYIAQVMLQQNTNIQVLENVLILRVYLVCSKKIQNQRFTQFISLFSQKSNLQMNEIIKMYFKKSKQQLFYRSLLFTQIQQKSIISKNLVCDLLDISCARSLTPVIFQSSISDLKQLNYPNYVRFILKPIQICKPQFIINPVTPQICKHCQNKKLHKKCECYQYFSQISQLIDKKQSIMINFDTDSKIIIQSQELTCMCFQCNTFNFSFGFFKDFSLKKSLFGFGIFTRNSYEKNEVICQYLGEVVGSKRTNQRGFLQDSHRQSYFFDSLIHDNEDQVYAYDAIFIGNEGRWINHNLQCNAQAILIIYDDANTNGPLTRILFKALRKIEKGEELYIDYGYSADVSHLYPWSQ